MLDMEKLADKHSQDIVVLDSLEKNISDPEIVFICVIDRNILTEGDLHIVRRFLLR